MMRHHTDASGLCRNVPAEAGRASLQRDGTLPETANGVLTPFQRRPDAIATGFLPILAFYRPTAALPAFPKISEHD